MQTQIARKFITINDKRMSYLECGSGSPIVFQHGNPTAAYLWRNVMPHLCAEGRCIAVDLIGMGHSDKLDHPGPQSYRYVEHREYLFAAWEALGINSNVTLVLHDWGSALGFDWAQSHPDAVTGIAYMEGIVRPLSWADWPAASRGIFQGFRSPAGDAMVLEKNVFVERVLPGSILRTLSEAEMAEYRRPYLRPGEDRRPTLTWPREIPIDGEPADVHEIVSRYAEWLRESDIPKLFINAEPGALLTGATRDYCRGFSNQREVTVAGSHFIQEDSPDEIGSAIAAWRQELVRIV